MTGIDRSNGMALVAALLLMFMMSALGAAFALVGSSETMIAANFRSAQEARYAARAAAGRALSDLAAAADWNSVLDGSTPSTFADGPPSDTRRMIDGSALDLEQIVNQANCRRSSSCSDAEMNAVTSERPWGVDNPRWRLYAYGPLTNLPGVDCPFYAVVLAGDDPAETDGNPGRDSAPPSPGAGILRLRVEVFGPRAAHRSIELSVVRANPSGVRVLSWRE